MRIVEVASREGVAQTPIANWQDQVFASIAWIEDLSDPVTGEIGTLILVTDKVDKAYMNAGLRIWNISDATDPRAVASLVPADPTEHLDPRPCNRIADTARGGTRKACSQDVLVDPRGIWMDRES